MIIYFLLNSNLSSNFIIKIQRNIHLNIHRPLVIQISLVILIQIRFIFTFESFFSLQLRFHDNTIGPFTISTNLKSAFIAVYCTRLDGYRVRGWKKVWQVI